MVPPTIETTIKENNTRYILYEQFGLKVLDLIDKDYLLIQHIKWGSYVLYKNKPLNFQSLTERLVPGGFLAKYKSIYYQSSFIVDNLVASASCFRQQS